MYFPNFESYSFQPTGNSSPLSSLFRSTGALVSQGISYTVHLSLGDLVFIVHQKYSSSLKKKSITTKHTDWVGVRIKPLLSWLAPG